MKKIVFIAALLLSGPALSQEEVGFWKVADDGYLEFCVYAVKTCFSMPNEAKEMLKNTVLKESAI